MEEWRPGAQGWEETPGLQAVCGNRPECDPARVGQRRMAGPLGDVSHRSERPGEDGGNVGSKGLTLF